MENQPSDSSASPFAGLAKKIRPDGSASARDAASQSPRLRLLRAHDDGPPCQVHVDGMFVAELAASEKKTVEVRAGDHVIQVEINGRRARADFAVVAGQTVRFRISFEQAGAGMSGSASKLGFMLRPSARIFLNKVD